MVSFKREVKRLIDDDLLRVVSDWLNTRMMFYVCRISYIYLFVSPNGDIVGHWNLPRNSVCCKDCHVAKSWLDTLYHQLWMRFFTHGHGIILKETQWMDIHSCLIHMFDADMDLHMVGMLGLITETVLTSMAADAFFHNRHHERLPSRSIDPHTRMWFYEITFTLVEMEVEMEMEGWRPMLWLGMVPCTRMPSWWRTTHSTSRLYLESSQSHQRRSKKHLWAILQ